MADIPVYLVAGFLDAGKTNFINGILEDGFARQDPTLLLCCEEGEEEYEKNALDNVTVITIEDEEDLKCSYLKELEKEYHPKQVLIEYNGMWQMERLYREVLPANWVLYQIMTFVYAPTFEMYAKNMGQLMMEKITNADMLVFNRCTPELRDALRKRNLRMVNRRADIYLEMEDGTSEDYLTGDVGTKLDRVTAMADRLKRRAGTEAMCLCSISCCGFSHDDFSGLGRACRPRNGLNWMVLVSPPERTGKDYDQHAPSTVYPSFAAERGIRRVDRAENTCQRADGA